MFKIHIFQKKEQVKKRVSFSHESSVLPPNGAVGPNSLIPPAVTNSPQKIADTFENDFLGMLNKVHATIER